MYKLRIRTWGLRKNLGFDEAKSILERMIGRQQPRDGEWNVSLSYVYSYIQRLPPDRREVLMKLYDQVVGSKPKPKPLPPLAPHLPVAPGTALRRAEECNHNLRLFILGGFGNQWWSQDFIPQPRVTELLIEWYHIAVVVSGALRRRRTVQAFQVLQPFFDEHAAVLKSQDPRLFGTTIAFVLIVSAAGHEVAASALRYSAQLTGTRWGAAHPYRAALQLLAGMSADEHRHWLPIMMDWYYQFLADQAQPRSPFQDFVNYCRRAARSFVRRLDATAQSDEYSNVEVSQDLDEISRSMNDYASANSPESDQGDADADAKTGEAADLSAEPEGQGDPGDGLETVGAGNRTLQHVVTQPTTTLVDDLVRLSVLTDLEQALAQDPRKEVQGDKVRQELDFLLNAYCARLAS